MKLESVSEKESLKKRIKEKIKKQEERPRDTRNNNNNNDRPYSYCPNRTRNSQELFQHICYMFRSEIQEDQFSAPTEIRFRSTMKQEYERKARWIDRGRGQNALDESFWCREIERKESEM